MIFRFRFLMSVTLVCAACTVIFFIMSEISDGQSNWGDDNIHLEYASAFFTGERGIMDILDVTRTLAHNQDMEIYVYF